MLQSCNIHDRTENEIRHRIALFPMTETDDVSERMIIRACRGVVMMTEVFTGPSSTKSDRHRGCLASRPEEGRWL